MNEYPRQIPANPPRRNPHAPPVPDRIPDNLSALRETPSVASPDKSRNVHPLAAIVAVSAALCALLFAVPALLAREASDAVAVFNAATGADTSATDTDAVASADTSAADTDAVASADTSATDTDAVASADTSAADTDAVASADTSAADTDAVASADTSAADTDAVVSADTSTADTDAVASTAGQRDEDCVLMVLDKKNGEVSGMTMREYLVCVLRGEMPGSFEQEALKAQAVAARTYTRYMLRSGGKHAGVADICNDSTCCQAYLSAAVARQRWGSLPDEEEQKLRAAVIDTDGEIMLYDGEPILAVFHSASAGLTRTSGDVWSGDKPYLQPVASPEPADTIPNYYSRADFTVEQLRDKLRAAFPDADLSGSPSEWLSHVSRDSAGSIVTLQVGGVKTQGSRVRTALNLRSACFTWEIGDGKASFYVTGHGHGVGLSQYGANQMAADGASYRDILTHYYTGVSIGGYVP